MKYEIILELKAQRDIFYIKKTDRQSFIKIEKLLRELQDHPYTGIGNPEQLKHEFSGYWSRRINKKDRLIYEINDSLITVYIISAKGHYNDK